MKTLNLPKTHFAPNYFLNPKHPITITLIGCGGTGSFIIERLERLDYALKQLEHPGIHVIAIDGDIVEPHNKGRQHFYTSDFGKNKANCLIERINFRSSLQWESIPSFVNNNSEIPLSNIFITAVDSAKFRNHFYNTIQEYQSTSKENYQTPFYWLDCGNGKDFGQVIMGTIQKNDNKNTSEKFEIINELKNIIDFYGNVEDFDNTQIQGIESCSFIESINKQDLFINDAISIEAVEMLWKLLRNFHISHNAVFINKASQISRGSLLHK